MKLITLDELKQYVAEDDGLIEAYVEGDRVFNRLYAYLDAEGRLTHKDHKNPYSVELQGDFLNEYGEWNDDYFANPEDHDGWLATLKEMLDKLNDSIQTDYWD